MSNRARSQNHAIALPAVHLAVTVQPTQRSLRRGDTLQFARVAHGVHRGEVLLVPEPVLVHLVLGESAPARVAGAGRLDFTPVFPRE